jgi:hypothetical protein
LLWFGCGDKLAAQDEFTSAMKFLLATRCRFGASATTVTLASRRLANAATGARLTFLEGTPAFLGRAR